MFPWRRRKRLTRWETNKPTLAPYSALNNVYFAWLELWSLFYALGCLCNSFKSVYICLFFLRPFPDFHITYAGCKLGCHSPFNAFKSDHWSVAGLFKMVAVYNGEYSSFRKFLFIDCCSVLVEEPVPDIVLNPKEACYVPKVMFALQKRRLQFN